MTVGEYSFNYLEVYFFVLIQTCSDLLIVEQNVRPQVATGDQKLHHVIRPKITASLDPPVGGAETAPKNAEKRAASQGKALGGLSRG